MTSGLKNKPISTSNENLSHKLKTLKVEGKTPEACVRYASFSNTL